MKVARISVLRKYLFAGVVIVFLVGTVGCGIGPEDLQLPRPNDNGQPAAVDAQPAGQARAASVYIKYDGVDGESRDEKHDKWIDVLSIDWGAHTPSTQLSGSSRRQGIVEIADMKVTVVYDKSSPKLQEKCLKGEVIPKLELEVVGTFGGRELTYITYELTNVMITSYEVSWDSTLGAAPAVVVGNNFEEIKITYTEYDDAGSSKGSVETEFNRIRNE